MSQLQQDTFSTEEKAYETPVALKSNGRRKTVYISGLLAALGGVSQYLCRRISLLSSYDSNRGGSFLVYMRL
jgi:hypothetical protein